MEPIEIFHHLHTYSNHPVACAAALKNIEMMQGESLIEHSGEVGEYILERLKPLESHRTVGEARGTGLWAALDFTSDKKKRRLIRIVDRAKTKRLLSKMMGQALEFAPPSYHQKKRD